MDIMDQFPQKGPATWQVHSEWSSDCCPSESSNQQAHPFPYARLLAAGPCEFKLEQSIVQWYMNDNEMMLMLMLLTLLLLMMMGMVMVMMLMMMMMHISQGPAGWHCASDEGQGRWQGTKSRGWCRQIVPRLSLGVKMICNYCNIWDQKVLFWLAGSAGQLAAGVSVSTSSVGFPIFLRRFPQLSETHLRSHWAGC